MKRASLIVAALLVACAASARELPNPMALVPGADAYRAGHLAENKRQWRAALEHFQAAEATQGPLTPYARIRAARVLNAAGQGEEARRQMQAVLTAFPEGPWVRMAHAELAALYTAAGNYAEADRHYAVVDSFQLPNTRHLADVRPWWYYDVAKSAAENRIRLAPNNPANYAFFRDVAEHTFYSGPRRDATEVLSRSPLLEDRLLGAWGLVRASDPSGARRLVLSSIAELSSDPGNHGDATLAQAAYVTHLLVDRQGMPVGMQVGPNQRWLHLTLAWAVYQHANRGSFATAESLMDVLLEAAGDSRASGDALNWLATAYREKGQRADAVRTYERLVEHCPTHRMVDRALLAIGDIHAEAGAHETAVGAWQRLVELRPDDTTVGAAWFSKGELFERLGDTERARAAYAGGSTWRPANFLSHRCADRLAALGDARAAATQNLRLSGSSSYLRPLPIEVPAFTDPAAPLRTDERYLRLKFFGELGVTEGEWEALDLVLNPPSPQWERALYAALAETGFAHSAGQLADGNGWGRDGARQSVDRIRLDLPLIHWRHIRALADEMQIDPYLILAVARQESTFRPALRSHAGASGMMQVMPGTATWLAEVDGRVRPEHAEHLMDPYSSMRMGAVYIRRMLNFWDGDVVKALASYNAGPGNVRKWVNQRPNQSTHDFIESIPFSETKDYVKRVTANYAGYYTLYGPPPS